MNILYVDILAKLRRTIQRRKISYVVEAEIRSFFDRLNQEWLLQFLGVRIGDKRVFRLIWRILKSGVMDDGLVATSEEGTPQGGSLSALLSNVYLHYVLDLWFERRFRPGCRGEAHLYRFADTGVKLMGCKSPGPSCSFGGLAGGQVCEVIRRPK